MAVSRSSPIHDTSTRPALPFSDRLDRKQLDEAQIDTNMAETSNDDDAKSNKRSHADFTGEDGSGTSRRDRPRSLLQ